MALNALVIFFSAFMSACHLATTERGGGAEICPIKSRLPSTENNVVNLRRLEERQVGEGRSSRIDVTHLNEQLAPPHGPCSDATSRWS